MTGPAQPAGRVQNITFTAPAEASDCPGAGRIDAAKKNGPNDESFGPQCAAAVL
jgi:hypothetical protein